MSWGSTPCQSYSSMGKHECDSSASEAYHNIWLQERRALAEQEAECVYFHENSPNYPLSKQTVELESTHCCVSILVSGTDLGLPYARNRRLTAGWHRGRYAWMGSQDPKKEFHSLFGRDVVASGDLYLTASDDEVFADYEKRA
eukprot:4020460-Amphidinium_carterae.1